MKIVHNIQEAETMEDMGGNCWITERGGESVIEKFNSF
jgi:hypothetical protein